MTEWLDRFAMELGRLGTPAVPERRVSLGRKLSLRPWRAASSISDRHTMADRRSALREARQIGNIAQWRAIVCVIGAGAKAFPRQHRRLDDDR